MSAATASATAEERSETFLACNDDKSLHHFRSNGTVGYGKFKGAPFTNGEEGMSSFKEENGLSTSKGVKNGKNGHHPTTANGNGVTSKH